MNGIGTIQAIRAARQAGQSQRGVAAPMVALSLLVLFGFAAFAVDLGHLHTKKRQMQTAADMAALAGAQALIEGGLTSDSAVSAATDAAVAYGQKNVVAADQPGLAVRSEDVAVDTGNGTVTVVAGVTRDRGNPAQLFLARALGYGQSDVFATATAQVFASNGSRCLLPLMVPLNFTWNDACDPSRKFNGNGQLDYGSTCEKGSIKLVPDGYPIGSVITIKYGDPQSAVAPGQFNPVDFPPANRGNPVPGGNAYRTNLEPGCGGSGNSWVQIGDTVQTETGNMQGPTRQGLQGRFDADPNAAWDSSSNSVVNSAYSDPLDPVNGSPRVADIAFYDPNSPPTSGKGTITVAGLGAIFIESVDNKGNVQARFIRAEAEVTPQDQASQSSGSTLYVARLIQ